VFHRHRKHGTWYPDKRRSFVVPIGCGEALGRAVAAASVGAVQTPTPAWLETLDENRSKLLPKLEDLNSPEHYLKRERHRLARGWGMGPFPMPSLWRAKKKRWFSLAR
jgi:hypothetical protein